MCLCSLHVPMRNRILCMWILWSFDFNVFFFSLLFFEVESTLNGYEQRANPLIDANDVVRYSYDKYHPIGLWFSVAQVFFPFSSSVFLFIAKNEFHLKLKMVEIITAKHNFDDYALPTIISAIVIMISLLFSVWFDCMRMFNVHTRANQMLEFRQGLYV